MRLKGAKQVHYDSGPNMTPLVDVVMVILIFLMLAGSFGGAAHYLLSNMPISSSGGGESDKKDPFEKKLLEVQVNGRADGQGGYVYRAKVGQFDTTQYAALKDELARLHQTYLTDGKREEQLQVVINPNRNCKYASVLEVYQAANDAGFTQIGFKQSNRQ